MLFRLALPSWLSLSIYLLANALSVAIQDLKEAYLTHWHLMAEACIFEGLAEAQQRQLQPLAEAFADLEPPPRC